MSATNADRERAAQLVEAVRTAAYWVGYDSAGRRYNEHNREVQSAAVDQAVTAIADALAAEREKAAP